MIPTETVPSLSSPTQEALAFIGAMKDSMTHNKLPLNSLLPVGERDDALREGAENVFTIIRNSTALWL